MKLREGPLTALSPSVPRGATSSWTGGTGSGWTSSSPGSQSASTSPRAPATNKSYRAFDQSVFTILYIQNIFWKKHCYISIFSSICRRYTFIGMMVYGKMVLDDIREVFNKISHIWILGTELLDSVRVMITII